MNWRRLQSGGLFLVLLQLAVGGRVAAAQEARDVQGTVRVLVVGPDGKPMADTDIELDSTEDGNSIREVAPLTRHVKTDARGIALFQWAVGNARVSVRAGDRGYGVTGVVEVLPNALADAPLPPLVPFARVSGRFPGRFIGRRDLTVEFRRQYFGRTIKAEVDPDGRFVTALPAGDYWLWAFHGREHIASCTLDLTPGQVVEHLDLRELPPTEIAASTQPNAIGREEPQEQTIVWAEGTVRDEGGAPVPAADVYAAAVYHGGMRMYERASKATTDAQGRYRIKGEGGLSAFSATLVAHKQGMTPGFAWISLPDVPYADVPEGAERPSTRMATPPAQQRDFVLSTRGGKLRIRVRAGGQPAIGTMVELRREAGSLRDTWAAGSDDPAQAEVEQIVYPRGAADSEGVIAFDHLPPGRYHVTAVRGSEEDLSTIITGVGAMSGNSDRPISEASGVAVELDQTTEFQMALRPRDTPAKLRVIDVNGAPRIGKSNIESLFPPPHTMMGSGQIELDRDGVGPVREEINGIWRFSCKYRRTPYAWADPPEPYFSAAGAVAISPLLAGQEPVTLTTRRVEPGSIEVQLVGVDGKPARGVVTIGQAVGNPRMLGSTDDSGRVRFDAVPSGAYTAKAYIHGQDGSGADPVNGEGPLPDDQSLGGRMFVLPQTITAESNRLHKLTLRTRPAGFIRGKAISADGRMPEAYQVYAVVPDGDAYVHVRQRLQGGEFLAGPFATGTVELVAFVYTDDGGSKSSVLAEAVEGQVRRTEIHMSGLPNPPRRLNSLLVGPGGAMDQGTGEQQLSGRVLLNDKTTPANGATLLYFPKGEWQPTLGAMTDVRGALHSRGLWYFNNAQPQEPAGSPQRDAIVAMLPGACGACVVDVDGIPNKPLELVLPKPLRVSGKVTIGGAPATVAGGLLVEAQYQGKGKLDNLLSVWVTPQQDGSFDLRGLTPGTYEVQASLDGIWVSKTIKLNVGQVNPPAITLDIAAPAGPICVELVDAAGRPLAGVSVTVDRPDGPLTSFHWPPSFTSDGAGRAWIPALESGNHLIHIPDASLTREVAAPDLGTGKPTVVRIQVMEIRK